MKIKNNKEKILWMAFAILGFIFVAVGTIVSINVLNYTNTNNTKGTITKIATGYDDDGDTTHDVYVSYNVNGKNYESLLNSYASNFYEGKVIDIYYDKENPRKIGVKSLDLLCLIFPGIGMIFLILGSGGLIAIRKKNNLEKRLKQNGVMVYATYIETVMNTSYQVNGCSPYNIICEWINPEDNQKYIFKSKNIWYNPTNTIEEKKIQQFAVYIDPNNKKKYTVDVDGLLDNVVDLT